MYDQFTINGVINKLNEKLFFFFRSGKKHHFEDHLFGETLSHISGNQMSTLEERSLQSKSKQYKANTANKVIKNTEKENLKKIF